MGNTNNKRRRQTATGATTALHTQPTTDFKQRSITTDWLDSSERSSKQMRTCRKPSLSLSGALTPTLSRSAALSRQFGRMSAWVCVCVWERQSSIVCNLRMDCVRRRQRHVHQYMCTVCVYSVMAGMVCLLLLLFAQVIILKRPRCRNYCATHTHIYTGGCVCVDIMLIVLN